MNGFSSVLTALALIWSAAASLFAARTAIQLRELRAQLRPLPLSRLQSLETSLSETQEALQELANRFKMQKVRAATNHVAERKSDLPDPYTNPDAWRVAMNSKLAKNRIGINE